MQQYIRLGCVCGFHAKYSPHRWENSQESCHWSCHRCLNWLFFGSACCILMIINTKSAGKLKLCRYNLAISFSINLNGYVKNVWFYLRSTRGSKGKTHFTSGLLRFCVWRGGDGRGTQCSPTADIEECHARIQSGCLWNAPIRLSHTVHEVILSMLLFLP